MDILIIILCIIFIIIIIIFLSLISYNMYQISNTNNEQQNIINEQQNIIKIINENISYNMEEISNTKNEQQKIIKKINDNTAKNEQQNIIKKINENISYNTEEISNTKNEQQNFIKKINENISYNTEEISNTKNEQQNIIKKINDNTAKNEQQNFIKKINDNISYNTEEISNTKNEQQNFIKKINDATGKRFSNSIFMINMKTIFFKFNNHYINNILKQICIDSGSISFRKCNEDSIDSPSDDRQFDDKKIEQYNNNINDVWQIVINTIKKIETPFYYKYTNNEIDIMIKDKLNLDKLIDFENKRLLFSKKGDLIKNTTYEIVDIYTNILYDMINYVTNDVELKDALFKKFKLIIHRLIIMFINENLSSFGNLFNAENVSQVEEILKNITVETDNTKWHTPLDKSVTNYYKTPEYKNKDGELKKLAKNNLQQFRKLDNDFRDLEESLSTQEYDYDDKLFHNSTFIPEKSGFVKKLPTYDASKKVKIRYMADTPLLKDVRRRVGEDRSRKPEYYQSIFRIFELINDKSYHYDVKLHVKDLDEEARIIIDRDMNGIYKDIPGGIEARQSYIHNMYFSDENHGGGLFDYDKSGIINKIPINYSNRPIKYMGRYNWRYNSAESVAYIYRIYEDKYYFDLHIDSPGGEWERQIHIIDRDLKGIYKDYNENDIRNNYNSEMFYYPDIRGSLKKSSLAS